MPLLWIEHSASRILLQCKKERSWLQSGALPDELKRLSCLARAFCYISLNVSKVLAEGCRRESEGKIACLNHVPKVFVIVVREVWGGLLGREPVWKRDRVDEFCCQNLLRDCAVNVETQVKPSVCRSTINNSFWQSSTLMESKREGRSMSRMTSEHIRSCSRSDTVVNLLARVIPFAQSLGTDPKPKMEKRKGE